MLEDGTVFERKGLDCEQPLQFITDEGWYVTNNSSIFIDLVNFSLSLQCMDLFETEYNK